MIKLLLIAAIVGAIAWYFLRPKPPTLPDVAEARAILGVGQDASDDEIRAAHRRLLTAVHPDKGGSADLTRRINAAREVLLRTR